MLMHFSFKWYLFILSIVLIQLVTNPSIVNAQNNQLVFQLVHGQSDVIKEVEFRKYSITSDLIESLKVVSGDGYRIVLMEVTLARGTAFVRSSETTSALIPRRFRTITIPGDRLLIKIKRVLKAPFNESNDRVDVGDVTLQVDIINN